MLDIEVFDQLNVNIDIGEVLRLLGYRGGKRPEASVTEILGEEAKEAQQLIKPKAIHREVKVLGAERSSIRLENDMLLRVGEKGALWWYGIHSLAIALCTIGKALEERVSTLFGEGKYAEALTLDSIGSIAVENVSNQVNHFICLKALNLGIKIGPRLSPGYGKWPLTDQRLIFELLPGESIGVHLNEQCMMIPRKSVSFCVGLGTQENLWKINPCRYCGMSNCLYRRANKVSRGQHV